MPESRSFAYSLSQDEDGWRWCVYDEDGVTVADGAHPSQAAAQAAVERLLGRSHISPLPSPLMRRGIGA